MRKSFVLLFALLFAVPVFAAHKHKKEPIPPLVWHGMKLTWARCQPVSVGNSDLFALYAIGEYGPKHKKGWQHNLGTFRQGSQEFVGGTIYLGPASQGVSSIWTINRHGKMFRACGEWLMKVRAAAWSKKPTKS